MAKTLQILFLGLAIVLSGSVIAQNKLADRNARHDKVMKLRKGGLKHAKKVKKAPLFTKTTTIFSEDFTNGLDTTWRNYDMDGDNYFWEYDAAIQCMMSWSYDTLNSNALYPDNWLITPKITIPANGAVLSYGYFAYDDYWFDEVYGVLVSPSGSDYRDSFYVSLIEDTLITDAYTTKQFSLNQFAGQSVRIAFVHHNCDDWWALGLDDVEVFQLDSVDLAVVSTDLLATTQVSNNASINAVIANNGTTPMSNVNVYCDINGTVSTATVASIASLQTATATFSGINFSSVGATYNVKIYVADPADGDNSNDTLTAATVAMPAASIAWDFENDTVMPAGFTVASYDRATAYNVEFFPNNEPWNVKDLSEYIYYYEYIPEGLDGGHNMALAQSWFDENSDLSKSMYPANRWMITPAINLTSGNYVQWDAMSYEEEYPDDYRVRISTTNTDTGSFTTLFTKISEEAEWQRRTVDLSAYAGRRVYLAFQLISDDQNMLLVDNIKILGNATIAGDEPDPEGLATADNDVRIYPNPATDNIRINANSQITLVELIDMTGRVVMTQDGNVKSLNISALSEGIYTMRVVSENGVSLKRVVKK